MEEPTKTMEVSSEVQPAENLQNKDTVGEAQETVNKSSFAEGGQTERSFDLVFWVLSPLLIVASLYSIYYHKQALNKLYDNPKEKDLQNQLDELKSKLKNLTGAKYKML